MTSRKTNTSKQRVMVVLDGVMLSTEKTGIEPLSDAVKTVTDPDDEILVLILLQVNDSTSGYDEGTHDQNHKVCDVNFLREKIGQSKEVYLQILRPFHERCKKNGVKLQVKIAAGFRTQDIIADEANNTKATRIIIDSCFTRELTFRLSGTDCDVTLARNHDVNEEPSRAPHYHDAIPNDAPESSRVAESSNEIKRSPTSTSPEYQRVLDSLSGLELYPKSPKVETIPEREEVIQVGIDAVAAATRLLGRPVEVPWDVVMEMTSGFSMKMYNFGKKSNGMSYVGYVSARKSFVLVNKYEDVDRYEVLEAEKRAAMHLRHKNILGLIAYHRSENGIVLVYPFSNFGEGLLDRYVCDLQNKHLKLKFRDKMKIAIDIAQAIRYMHDDCPQGPVVHGNLQLTNILLKSDLQPMIFGFAQATWLHVGLTSPKAKMDRVCCINDGLNHNQRALVQGDIYAFGVLLLRLFCRNLDSEDDERLIKWARPLMIERKFHELLDEDSDKPDIIGIYRVMAAAMECTKTKPTTTRSCMSKVISILKGENFCAVLQSSPSDSSL